MEPAADAAKGGQRRRTRVLVLIKGLGVGGAERLVVGLAAERDRERFDYEVACVLAGQRALATDLEADGVPVHDLGATASVDLRWVPRLRRLLDRGGFDVLHSHLPYAASFGRLAALSLPARRRPALAYTEHSLWTKTAVLTRALNRATAPLDDALIVVSPAARDALPRSLRHRARVVVHGVDRARSRALVSQRCAVRAEVRRELQIEDGEIVALTVANFREEKGYDVLMEAARLVTERGEPVRFVSVGWGPLEDDLHAKRDALGLGDRFRFLGLRPDPLRLMAAADMLVLPSRHEGMPLALMEAMSVGLAVVASEVGGVPDLVTAGVEGILVAPGQPAALADAVVELARSEELRSRLGDAGLLRSASFDLSHAARTMETMYDELRDGLGR